jgi:hypothetical protein
MKYYYIYKTTNTINGKYYIGKHSTNDLDDGYLGSGLRLQAAIAKYGRESFSKEIICFTETKEELNIKEKEIVNESIVNDSLSYNMALGGQGGNLGEEVNSKIGKTMSAINKGVAKTESHKASLRNTWVKKMEEGFKFSEDRDEKISAAVTEFWEQFTPEERKKMCGHPGEKNGFFNKKHTEKTIEKMKANLPDRSGAKSPSAKPITWNGVTYGTRNECMLALGLNKRQFYKLIGEKQ